MADEKGSLWARMFAGTCGAVLVFALRIRPYIGGLNPERADVDTLQVLGNSALIGLPVLGLTLVYMALKKEMEAMDLVLSALTFPFLLTCLLGVIPVSEGSRQ